MDNAALRQSWSQFSAAGPEAAKYFYATLFVVAPEARSMFPTSTCSIRRTSSWRRWVTSSPVWTIRGVDGVRAAVGRRPSTVPRSGSAGQSGGVGSGTTSGWGSSCWRRWSCSRPVLHAGVAGAVGCGVRVGGEVDARRCRGGGADVAAALGGGGVDGGAASRRHRGVHGASELSVHLPAGSVVAGAGAAVADVAVSVAGERAAGGRDDRVPCPGDGPVLHPSGAQVAGR